MSVELYTGDGGGRGRPNLVGDLPAALAAGPMFRRSVMGYDRFEVTAEAEQAWLDLLATGPRPLLGGDQCTPGYYNNEGQVLPDGLSFAGLGYPQGAQAYFKYIDAWRTTGGFEGLLFSPR